jgi:AcrR family transcriptional regulator
MTIADIARAADVPVESVLRVLNHDEVSSDVETRVREAMARYGYGRMSELVSDGVEESPEDALGRVRRQLRDAVDGVVTELDAAGSSGALPDPLLRRLAQDIDEIKLELRRARSERLEDLTLVVDLITTSWRAVDRRLGGIDRKLDRLENPTERASRPRLP